MPPKQDPERAARRPKDTTPDAPAPRLPPRDPPRPADAIDLGRGAWTPRSAAVFTFSRSGGPGGQNVNKVNSRADLHVAIAAIRGLSPVARNRLLALAGSRLVRGEGGDGSLHFSADEFRSQFENKSACIERLSDLVTEAATIPRKRKKTKPSKGAKERRIESKKREGEKKKRRGERFE